MKQRRISKVASVKTLRFVGSFYSMSELGPFETTPTSTGKRFSFSRVLGVGVVFVALLWVFDHQEVVSPAHHSGTDLVVATDETAASSQEEGIAQFVSGFFESGSGEDIQEPLHLPMPVPLRGLYMTGWSAGNERMRERILGIADRTEINAVVIDIKDASGRLSYQPKDEALFATGVGTNRIKDLPGTIKAFHDKGIYVIGRIAVFQDPFYALRHSEDAFVDTRTGTLWRDYKGIAWLRPDSKAVWDYIVAIARDAHTQGFDEINVDYVRYPSDGPLASLARGTAESRTQVMESFFSYIGPLLTEGGMVLSADLFGLTMSASDDLGIGQVLERIAPHVDVVAPMVYPSHFASGAYGIASPAEHPGEMVRISLEHGIAKLEAAGIDRGKIRPWLQDFDLGAIYTASMVREQIDQSEGFGLSSWMLWDPRNLYTEGALTVEVLSDTVQ